MFRLTQYILVFVILWFSTGIKIGGHALNVYELEGGIALSSKYAATVGLRMAFNESIGSNLTWSSYRYDGTVSSLLLESRKIFDVINDEDIMVGPSFNDPCSLFLQDVKSRELQNITTFIPLCSAEDIITTPTTYTSVIEISNRVNVITAFVNEFDVNFVAILYINTDYGVSYRQAIVNQMGNRVLRTLPFSDTLELSLGIQSLKDFNIRTIICIPSTQYGQDFIQIAYDQGMMDNEHLWIVDTFPDLNTSLISQNYFTIAVNEQIKNMTLYNMFETHYSTQFDFHVSIYPELSPTVGIRSVWAYDLGRLFLNPNATTIISTGIEPDGFLAVGVSVTRNIDHLQRSFQVLSNAMYNFTDFNITSINDWVYDTCGSIFETRTEDGTCISCPQNTYNFLGDNSESCLLCPENTQFNSSLLQCQSCSVNTRYDNITRSCRLLSNTNTPFLSGIELAIIISCVIVLCIIALAVLHIRNLKKRTSGQIKFTSILFHEFRNPLNVIIGQIEYMKILALEDRQDEIVTELSATEYAANRARMIIQNVVDIYRLVNKKLRINVDTISVNRIVDKCSSLIMHDAQEKNISVIVSTEERMYCKGNHDKITQVLLNLLSNAIKFTDEGQITIAVTDCESKDQFLHDSFRAPDSKQFNKSGKYLRWSITDTGCGMDLAFIRKLNKHVPKMELYTGEGSGLGLYISREFLNLMNSQLFVASKKGQGTQFYFYLDKVDCTTQQIELMEHKHAIQQQQQEQKQQSNNDGSGGSFALQGNLFNATSISSSSENGSKIDTYATRSKGSNTIEIVVIPNQQDLEQPMEVIETKDKIIPESQKNKNKKKKKKKKKTKNTSEKAQDAIPLSVMVADDVRMNRVLMERIIKRMPRVILTNLYSVSSSQEVLSCAGIADVYILDHNFGKQDPMQGHELIPKLREKNPKARFIMYTGNIQENHIKLYKSSGANHIWGKPLPPPEVMEEQLLELVMNAKEKI